MKNLKMTFIAFAAVMIRGMASAQPMHGHPHEASPLERSPFTMPQSLAKEHEHLHDDLEALLVRNAPVGPAAKKVAEALGPHFRMENLHALPPLGLLEPLSQGKIDESMRPAVEASHKLKAALPQMLAEHKAIFAALENLRKAGETAKDQKAVAFAENLALHAQTEEQVLYPAAILAGEFIGLKLK